MSKKQFSWLDESYWSGIGRNNKPKVIISANKRLKGDSGMQWTVDLAVTDYKEKPYMVINCIDSSASKDIENALTKIAAAYQDLYAVDAMIVLVVRKGKHEKGNNGPLGYDRLFESIHVDMIEWNPKHAFELVVDLLHGIRRHHNGKSMYGIKSVRDTAKSLTDKYPDLFADHRQIPKKTNCLELLQQIKEFDRHLNFGEIKDAISQEGICQSLVAGRLNSTSDARLEKILKKPF